MWMTLCVNRLSGVSEELTANVVYTIEVLAIYGHSTASTLESAVTT